MRLRPGFALLSIGIIATGCSDDGLAGQSTAAAQTTTSGAEAGSTTMGSADPAVSTGSGSEGDPTTAGPDPDSTSTGQAETTSTTNATDTTGTTGTDTDTTTDGHNQACVDGCVVEFMCGTEWSSEDECVTWCETNLDKANAFSPFCRDAWEALSACLGTLTCEEFTEWQDPAMFPYPCSDADAILNVECEGQ
ncbi:MAG: hypothetical protein KDK70_29020 [Myxococcales bacterium]|nr:hypothetical protein [Myxococcales bacterium]